MSLLRAHHHRNELLARHAFNNFKKIPTITVTNIKDALYCS